MTILGVMILKIEQTILDDIDDAYYQNTKHFSGPKKLTQFKYGFKNEAGKILRIKYIYTPDAKENDNIYKNNIDEEKNIELLAVIKIGDSYHIVEIKSFNKEKISLNKSSFDSEFNDSKEINIILNAYINDSSIYKLSSINDTIYGISQRAENEKIDENAIKKLFHDENPTCS